MLLQDVIYDIIKEKAKTAEFQQYEKSATLRDLEVTLLQNFAKTLDLVTNGVETKDEYLNRILNVLLEYIIIL
jgi:hypothetical protein